MKAKLKPKKKIPKKSRGITLPRELWAKIRENGLLINYNDNLFIESCLIAMIEMIEKPEKRYLPLLIRMIDEAKIIEAEIDQLKPLKNLTRTKRRQKRANQ